jgi:hypothetical protein
MLCLELLETHHVRFSSNQDRNLSSRLLMLLMLKVATFGSLSVSGSWHPFSEV